MWGKKGALFLISLGAAVTIFNFSSFYQGYSAYSKPQLTENDFAAQTETSTDDVEVSNQTSLTQEKPLYTQIPKVGDKIGELTIPKLEKTLPIYHGTTKEVLKKGVGHLQESVLPGENNNSVLSGHRDTVFRGLGDVGINDKLIVSTDAGEFLYKVKKVRIVDKDDTTVIVPKPTSTLTVTTCYPFGYIGHAPKRFILVGELISKNIKQ